MAIAQKQKARNWQGETPRKKREKRPFSKKEKWKSGVDRVDWQDYNG